MLNPSNYPFLLHYFRNLYSSNDKINDLVTGMSFQLKKLANIIGYNYVINFQEIVVCNEGYILSGSTCQAYSSLKCKYSSNQNDDCILCQQFNPYLYYNSTSAYCFSTCPDSFYADKLVMQCRQCDSSCFQCNQQFYNNCTACQGINYLVRNLSICVPNCLLYNLTASLNIPNLCVPCKIIYFYLVQANATITNYNISENIDNNTLTYLVASIYNNTANNLTSNWRFSIIETNNLNLNYTVSKNPFLSSTVNLGISLDPSFFMIGKKYVFYLDITNSFQNAQVTVSQQFIISINNGPYS